MELSLPHLHLGKITSLSARCHTFPLLLAITFHSALPYWRREGVGDVQQVAKMTAAL
jgi:hypothetical protein